jgi:hypothetical protein
VEKVAVEGYRYLVVLKEPLPLRIDLYVLCKILNWVKFMPRYVQVEVWADGRHVAYFYYKLQGSCYVGPSRRPTRDGGWAVYGRLYCVKQIGSRYVVTDGEQTCR